jgi:aspartate racemase
MSTVLHSHPPCVQYQCVHHQFEAQVQRAPNAIAVRDGAASLTYAELNARANQLARHLCGLGVASEVMVGLAVDRSIATIVGLLGILKAGGAYIPLDPSYPRDRLRYMLQDSRVPVLVTQSQWLPQFDCEAQVVCLDADADEIARHSQENLDIEVAAHNLLFVMYTSGTTGQPKGVMANHANLLGVLASARTHLPMGETDVWTQLHSYSFGFAGWEIWGALLHGGQLSIVPSSVASNPEALYNLVGREGVTMLSLTPSAFRLFEKADALLNGSANWHLRTIVCCGEALEPYLVQSWLSRHDDSCPQLANTYALCETGGQVTYRRYTAADLQPKLLSTIGKPLPGVQIRILSEDMQPLPAGDIGEMYVGGAVARGYLNQPELTQQRFVPDPFSDEAGARLYKSGDLARYLPDGQLEFLGRRDRQIKIRGYRIELGEVEAALARHPAIDETVASIWEDSPDDKRLVAYVVFSRGQAPSSAELRTFLKCQLPDYMIPFAFIPLEKLPVTPNGKLDRQELPVPQLAQRTVGDPVIAPRNEWERQLVDIWEAVLKIHPIGIRDNFFDLGGNSFLAIQLCIQIEKVLSKHFPISTLIEAPTIELLGHLCGQAEGIQTASSLVTIQPHGSRPPLFCIHAITGNPFFYRRLAPYLGLNQPLYGLQAKGLDGLTSPETQIEDLADRYIKDIHTVQPSGPYCLAGYSFGFLVAYEMARQLHARGETVSLLISFDREGPNLPARLGQNRLAAHMDNLAQLDLQEQLIYIWNKTRWTIGERLPDSFHERMRQTRRFWVERRRSAQALGQFDVEMANQQAESHYRPQPYAGAIVLFRSQIRSARAGVDPQGGWGGLALGGVEVRNISGDHHSVFENDAHLKVLAHQLMSCLDKARKSGSDASHSDS